MGANASLYATGVQATSTAVNSYSQSQSTKAQGAYESQQLSLNADIADYQAQDSQRRGALSAQEAAKRANKVLGSQRASLAAQGIVLDSGSAAAIQEETQKLSVEDQMAIQMNAAREAFGFKTQSNNYRSQAGFAEMSSKNIARNTLISGGMNAAGQGLEGYGKWYQNKYGKSTLVDSGLGFGSGNRSKV